METRTVDEITQMHNEVKRQLAPAVDFVKSFNLAVPPLVFEKNGIIRYGENKLNVKRKTDILSKLRSYILQPVYDHLYQKKAKETHDAMVSFINGLNLPDSQEPDCWIGGESIPLKKCPLFYNYEDDELSYLGVKFAEISYSIDDGELARLAKNVAKWVSDSKQYENKFAETIGDIGFLVPFNMQVFAGHLSFLFNKKSQKYFVIPQSYSGRKLLLNLRGKEFNYGNYIRPAVIMLGDKPVTKADFPLDIFMPDVNDIDKQRCIDEICQAFGIAD